LFFIFLVNKAIYDIIANNRISVKFIEKERDLAGDFENGTFYEPLVKRRIAKSVNQDF